MLGWPPASATVPEGRRPLRLLYLALPTCSSNTGPFSLYGRRRGTDRFCSYGRLSIIYPPQRV